MTPDDLHFFNEGTHTRMWSKFGAHPFSRDGRTGVKFAVWAPNARAVSAVGDFNAWNPDRHPLKPLGESGVWEGFVDGMGPGTVYKYHVRSKHNGYAVNKADPVGFRHEVPPATASVVHTLEYEWNDTAWMDRRRSAAWLREPVSVYELHLGSWRRDARGRSLSYREIAEPLADHVARCGFTHVELLPIMEHPFAASWGYQTTGYFAPTSRFGTPQDFMFLVDTLHQRGIGVILDWVPSHFPTDEHGPVYFDGTHLYEHADPRQGIHPDWKSAIFNYGRPEVRSFLLSSAMLWMQVYHADALRVDAVASMLYLDYSRKDGEWIPNRHGGRENLEAIDFLRRLNVEVYQSVPGAQTVAEESTAWPGVSKPTYVGGLGFGFKWDMGWMHDTLRYMALDPIHRRFHHTNLTFRGMYAFSENFLLPLSHDEVVHGKGSLIGKMPGDEWQRLAGLRLLLAWMWAQPGKKLLFMGGEIGQWREWNHDDQIDWPLLDRPGHAGVQRLVGDLNRLYRGEPALHLHDCDPAGFEWIDPNDSENSVVTFVRQAEGVSLLAAFNFTPIPRHNHRVGVPSSGRWEEVLNTDAKDYGGSGQGNLGGVEASPLGWHGRAASLTITLPPLGAVIFRSPKLSAPRQGVTGNAGRGVPPGDGKRRPVSP